MKNDIIYKQIWVLFIVAIFTISPFNQGWINQIDRPKAESCHCQIEKGNWITGKILHATWIVPNCDGSRCWGVNYTYIEPICELPYVYNEGCFLTKKRG